MKLKLKFSCGSTEHCVRRTAINVTGAHNVYDESILRLSGDMTTKLQIPTHFSRANFVDSFKKELQ